MRVVIDGRCVLDEADLHRRLSGAFGYGPGHRPGLDTLHARLAVGDPRPLELICINTGSLRLALGTAGYGRFVALLEAVEAVDAGKSWAQRFVLRLFD